jgi:uncharacterized protein (DUF1499 family)
VNALAILVLLALSTVMPDCPDSPNCVSSLASDPARRIAPLSYHGHGPDQARLALLTALASLPRTEIVARDATTIKAVAKSRIFGFVDDLTFVFDDKNQLIHARSASRIGRWDLGVNGRRMERLREGFKRALKTQEH